MLIWCMEDKEKVEYIQIFFLWLYMQPYDPFSGLLYVSFPVLIHLAESV